MAFAKTKNTPSESPSQLEKKSSIDLPDTVSDSEQNISNRDDKKSRTTLSKRKSRNRDKADYVRRSQAFARNARKLNRTVLAFIIELIIAAFVIVAQYSELIPYSYYALIMGMIILLIFFTCLVLLYNLIRYLLSSRHI